MIIPAVLESNIEKTEQNLALAGGFSPIVQMDITPQTPFFKIRLPKIPSLQIESHLMLEEQEDFAMYLKYLEHSTNFPPLQQKNMNTTKMAKISKICLQIENLELTKSLDFLTKVKTLGLETGISLFCQTSPERINDYFPFVNYIQILGVNAGKQGQELIPETLTRVQKVKMLFPHIPLQVDGGIKKENITLLLQLGVNNVVIGSAIFNAKSPQKEYEDFVRMEKEWKTKK